MRETLTGERAVPTLRALAHYVAQSFSTELLLVERGQTAPRLQFRRASIGGPATEDEAFAMPPITEHGRKQRSRGSKRHVCCP